MKPKKSRILYQELSEQHDISKNLVETLVEFYYKNVKNLLTELHHPRINITGLGLFTARKKGINKAIPRFKKYLENHDTSTYSAYYNKKVLEERLDFLKSIKEQIEDEEKRKKEFLIKKNEFKKNMDK